MNTHHLMADELREADKLDDALTTINLAIDEYISVQDAENLCRAYLSRSLIYKNMYMNNNNEEYVKKSQQDAEQALTISKNPSINTKALVAASHFKLGEVAMLKNNYDEAVEEFNTALELHATTQCEKGNYMVHLGEALYHAGETQRGLQQIIAGAALIHEHSSQVEEYVAHVWESGAFLKLHDAIKDVDQSSAERALDMAGTIINADPNLTIRQRQYEDRIKGLK